VHVIRPWLYDRERSMLLDHGYITGKEACYWTMVICHGKKHVIGPWLYDMEMCILLDRGYMTGKGACYWNMVI